jgi:hypothetical protein
MPTTHFKLFFLAALFVQLLLNSATSAAQKIGADSKGKSVFTYFTNSPRIEINSTDELSIGKAFGTDSTQYVYTSTSQRTVSKWRGFTARVSALNADDRIVLSKLLSTRLGGELKVGVQSAVRRVTTLQNIRGVRAWGINLIGSFDNFYYYDQNSKVISHEYPLTAGVEGDYDFFYTNVPAWLKPLRVQRFAIALHGSVRRTWNDDDLINYQDLDKVTVLPNAVALSDFRGRYGSLKTDVYQLRLAGSAPMYIGRLNPIPYAVFTHSVNGSTKLYPGLLLNILSKPVGGTSFSFPSTIGVGLDWAEQTWSKPNLFVRGTFSLESE